MTTYATTADVAVSLGRSMTAEETTAATGLLPRAELLITRRIADLTARIAADAALEDVVVMVESDAVARVLRNPNGVYQERIDDYSFTRDQAVSAGTLYISDDEWDMLLNTPGTSVPSEAFTIRPSGDPGYADDVADEGTWTTPTDFLP
jgi:hypothetical protein